MKLYLIYICILFVITSCYTPNADRLITHKPKYAPFEDRKHRNVFDATSKKQGLHKFYSRDKVLIYEVEYVDDRKHGYCKKYYSSTGKLREESNYFIGKKDGAFRRYNTRGKMVVEGMYKKGKKHGRWVYYYSVTGEMKYEGEYINNQRHGLWKFYTAKGIMHTKGMYEHGQRDEIWYYYDSEGNIIRSEKFDKGQLVSDSEDDKKQDDKNNDKTKNKEGNTKSKTSIKPPKIDKSK